MDSGDSGVTSPVLRVTAEITELRGKPERSDNHHNGSPSLISKECKNHSGNTKKKFLKPLYGYNPYERSCGGSYISSQNNSKNNVSSFTQKVMSAKLLRMKQLQNQLYETQAKLDEVLQENRTLKILQKRQENTLKKYEGNQEQLPQLMRSHHEEIRVLNEKYKQLRSSYRDLENRSKQKDHDLTNLREQHKHLLKLSKDKQLGEREKLAKKIEEMQITIDEQRKKIFMLNKKIEIEEKSFHHQLNNESMKQKKLQTELNSAQETINNLKATIEGKEKMSRETVSFRKSQQNSAKNSNLPSRVSIRQPIQLLPSGDTAELDESESDDSFTMNYKPEIHRNSSLESDDSASSKDKNVEDDKTQPNKISSYSNLLKSNQKNGLKNSIRIPNPDISKINPKVEQKEGNVILKKEESKVRRKLQAQRTFQGDQTVTHVSRRRSLNKLLSNMNKKKEDDEKSRAVSLNSQIENDLGNSTSSHSKEHSDLKPENLLEAKSENNDTEMKLSLDKEFEKYFQNTELSDEAINEFYQKDFKEEIYELERKFQELNEKNNEKIENMKAANRLDRNEQSSEDSESEEISSPNPEPKWEATTKTMSEPLSTTEVERKTVIPTLGENQKASLLKALNNIDEDTHKNIPQEQPLELPQINHHNPLLTSDLTYFEKVNELKKSYSRTRRKSEVLRDLFGSDATVLKS